MLASYNLQSTFSGQPFYNAEITPWIIGGILALVTGWCLLGGGNRIVKVTSTLVPFMGIVYILISLLVVVLNIGQLPSVLAQIFEEAFDFKAIFAGFAGSAMMQEYEEVCIPMKQVSVLPPMRRLQWSVIRLNRDWYRCCLCLLTHYYCALQLP